MTFDDYDPLVEEKIDGDERMADSTPFGFSDAEFDKATGRDKFFKAENNKDYDLVIVGMKPIETEFKGEKKAGFELTISKIGSEVLPVPKPWTIRGNALKQIEPILKAAAKKGKQFVQIRYRKSLGLGQTDTQAIFTARNLDPDLDEFLAQDQRSR